MTELIRKKKEMAFFFHEKVALLFTDTTEKWWHISELSQRKATSKLHTESQNDAGFLDQDHPHW